MTVREKIARGLNATIFLILAGVGLAAGLGIGDTIYSNLTLIGTDDWIKCRVVFPVLGVVIMFWPAILIGQWVEDKID